MRSIATKLTLSHILVVLLAVVLVGLLSTWLIDRGFRQLAGLQAQRDAAGVAEALGSLAEAAAPPAAPLRWIEHRLNAPARPVLLRGMPFVLANPQQQVVFDRGGDLEGHPLPLPMRRTAAPVMVDGQTIGYVALPVERQMLNRVERSVVLRIYAGVAASSLLVGILAIVIGLSLSRRLTRPLRALTVAASAVAAGKTVVPLPLSSRDEVGDLARAFSTMAQELAHQQQLRRSLVADIAHELRTPLSVLQLHTEALHDGVLPPSSATFASLQEEVRLLSHLVDDLRLLSLADAGQLAVANTAIDPVLAAERAVAIAQPHAQAQAIALCCHAGTPLPRVYADSQRLVQVLSGLLDNALRYTPQGGQVVLHVALAKGRPTTAQGPAGAASSLGSPFVTFAVSDSGAGIAPTDLPHLFERFYRADQARSRATGGSGLGLAIAQRLVAAMGGQIWVENLPGSGACFTIALPTLDYQQAFT